MRISNPANKGFTFIELLVVVSIIGVLASLIMISMAGSRARARDARRINDLRQIPSAQESVMNDNSAYQVSAQVTGTTPAIKNAANLQYLAPMADPLNEEGYQYVWTANNGNCGASLTGSYYCVLAKLEDSSRCGYGKYRYFVANNSDFREICVSNDAAHDYVANPPTCGECLSL